MFKDVHGTKILLPCSADWFMFALLNKNFNKHGKINVVFGANDFIRFYWRK